jgi:predicted NAD-dependent protein-ADP-ribosyltransferase YbiA (DUF1768 family)
MSFIQLYPTLNLYGVLSNNYNFNIYIDNINWKNVNKYIFGNTLRADTNKRIINNTKKEDILSVFNEIKRDIHHTTLKNAIKKGLRVKVIDDPIKYFNNNTLLDILKNTGDIPIKFVDNDIVFGIGSDGRGENLVGSILEEIRYEYKNKQPFYNKSEYEIFKQLLEKRTSSLKNEVFDMFVDYTFEKTIVPLPESYKKDKNHILYYKVSQVEKNNLIDRVYALYINGKLSEELNTKINTKNEYLIKDIEKIKEKIHYLESDTNFIPEKQVINDKEILIYAYPTANSKEQYQLFSPYQYTDMLNIENKMYPSVIHYIYTKLISDIPKINDNIAYTHILLDPKSNGQLPQQFKSEHEVYKLYLFLDQYNYKHAFIENIKKILDIKFNVDNKNMQDILLLTGNKKLILDKKNTTEMVNEYSEFYMTGLRSSIFKQRLSKPANIFLDSSFADYVFILKYPKIIYKWIVLQLEMSKGQLDKIVSCKIHTDLTDAPEYFTAYLKNKFNINDKQSINKTWNRVLVMIKILTNYLKIDYDITQQYKYHLEDYYDNKQKYNMKNEDIGIDIDMEREDIEAEGVDTSMKVMEGIEVEGIEGEGGDIDMKGIEVGNLEPIKEDEDEVDMGDMVDDEDDDNVDEDNMDNLQQKNYMFDGDEYYDEE